MATSSTYRDDAGNDHPLASHDEVLALIDAIREVLDLEAMPEKKGRGGAELRRRRLAQEWHWHRVVRPMVCATPTRIPIEANPWIRANTS